LWIGCLPEEFQQQFIVLPATLPSLAKLLKRWDCQYGSFTHIVRFLSMIAYSVSKIGLLLNSSAVTRFSSPYGHSFLHLLVPVYVIYSSFNQKGAVTFAIFFLLLVVIR
jgi:hypothetical protein